MNAGLESCEHSASNHTSPSRAPSLLLKSRRSFIHSRCRYVIEDCWVGTSGYKPGKMGAALLIRSEREDDRGRISDVVSRAYASVSWSDHREHLMIDRLRQTDAFLPELSLVAEADGEAIGHLLLTRASIGTGMSATATLALAPLSVVSEWQNNGVGKGLVREAHRRAMALGFGSVLCVGSPTYYPRFGYQLLAGYPITLPFEAPTDNQMILPLAPHALHGVQGVVSFAAGWLDH